jgi:DNA repair protein RadC
MIKTVDKKIHDDIKSKLFHLSTLTTERALVVFLKNGEIVKSDYNGVGTDKYVIWEKNAKELLKEATDLKVDEVYFIHNHPNEDIRHCDTSKQDILNCNYVRSIFVGIETRFFVVLGNNMNIYGVPNELQYKEY